MGMGKGLEGQVAEVKGKGDEKGSQKKRGVQYYISRAFLLFTVNHTCLFSPPPVTFARLSLSLIYQSSHHSLLPSPSTVL